MYLSWDCCVLFESGVVLQHTMVLQQLYGSPGVPTTEADYIDFPTCHCYHWLHGNIRKWQLEEVSPSLSWSYSQAPKQLGPLLQASSMFRLWIFCFCFDLHFSYLSWCLSLYSSPHSAPSIITLTSGTVLGSSLLNWQPPVGCAHRRFSTDILFVSLKRRNGEMKRI